MNPLISLLMEIILIIWKQASQTDFSFLYDCKNVFSFKQNNFNTLSRRNLDYFHHQLIC